MKLDELKEKLPIVFDVSGMAQAQAKTKKAVELLQPGDVLDGCARNTSEYSKRRFTTTMDVHLYINDLFVGYLFGDYNHDWGRPMDDLADHIDDIVLTVEEMVPRVKRTKRAKSPKLTVKVWAKDDYIERFGKVPPPANPLIPTERAKPESPRPLSSDEKEAHIQEILYRVLPMVDMLPHEYAVQYFSNEDSGNDLVPGQTVKIETFTGSTTPCFTTVWGNRIDTVDQRRFTDEDIETRRVYSASNDKRDGWTNLSLKEQDYLALLAPWLQGTIMSVVPQKHQETRFGSDARSLVVLVEMVPTNLEDLVEGIRERMSKLFQVDKSAQAWRRLA